jgi:type IV pilus assembly protein PilW
MNTYSMRIRVARGFSVVELMVAMSLSLILLAGVLTVLYSSKLTYAENERTARLQEYARAGVDMILKDLRGGGFVGCRSIGQQAGDTALAFTSNLANNTNIMWNFARPVEGYDALGGGAWSPALTVGTFVPAGFPAPNDESDVIAIRTVRSAAPQYRVSTVPASVGAPFIVAKPLGDVIAARSTFVISDCQFARLFAASSVINGGAASTATTVAYATGAGGALDPSNANGTLPGSLDVAGSVITPIETVVYYIAPSQDLSGPALWRRIGRRNPEELIEGVENLQIEFGVDTDGDQFANAYIAPGAVLDWREVIAARIGVLIRSPDETGVETDNRTYQVLSETVAAAADRRQRIVFTTTVALRNTTQL